MGHGGEEPGLAGQYGGGKAKAGDGKEVAARHGSTLQPHELVR